MRTIKTFSGLGNCYRVNDVSYEIWVAQIRACDYSVILVADINNYYNDPRGTNYMGKLAHSTHNAWEKPSDSPCIPWTEQDRKLNFPDGGRAEAKNYCRNPDNSNYTWCYYNYDENWKWCKLKNTSTYETIGY